MMVYLVYLRMESFHSSVKRYVKCPAGLFKEVSRQRCDVAELGGDSQPCLMEATSTSSNQNFKPLPTNTTSINII